MRTFFQACPVFGARPEKVCASFLRIEGRQLTEYGFRSSWPAQAVRAAAGAPRRSRQDKCASSRWSCGRADPQALQYRGIAAGNDARIDDFTEQALAAELMQIIQKYFDNR